MGEIFVTAMTNMFPQTGHFALAVGGSSNFFEYAVSISPRLFEGLKMTISKSFILNKLSGAYLSIIRGTPLMVQATFIYFGLSAALNMPITSFTASIIVLMLNSGAYLSEIFRSGISAINKGQMEAARSLGLPHGVAMRKIILPQAFRIVIPSVTNQFIITLKDTSILSVIGVAEMMRQSQQLIANNFRAFETYAIVAVWYYVLVIILTKLFKLLERRLAN